MTKLAIDKLVPGMRLSKPVFNKNGMVVLGEETELTQVLIDRIGSMEIEGANVHGYSQPKEPMEDMLNRLNERFRNVEKEPYMDNLKCLIGEHIRGLYE